MDTKHLYIGLMSGTSLDAIDAVLVDLSEGVKIIAVINTEIPEDIRQEIKALNSQQENELTRCLILNKKLAYLFGDAVLALLQKSNMAAKHIIAIGSHGQTLRHAPNGQYGYSLQIGDPNTIAELTNITVVADFRNRDISAGGQGAPLVPAFHQSVFAHPQKNRAVINIGGMANVSIFLNDGSIHGFDTGPGNVLMNFWAQKNINKPYDENGNWAKSGKTNENFLNAMLEEPFFKLPPPKSTGRELFDQHWLNQFPHLAQLETKDVQATLLELTARSIVNSLPKSIDQIFICGGGAYNTYLLERIHYLSGKPTENTSSLGVPAEWVEAIAFAWMAKQTINGSSSNLPEATGAKGKRILGGIYPKHSH